MDNLESTILEHYKTLIVKYRNPSWLNKLILGVASDTWIVSQKPYSKDDCIMLVDEIIGKWEMTQDQIKGVPLDYDFTLEDNGFNKACFSKRAFGYFWISDDRNLVHIGWLLGGMYGEGWDYEVINKDGQINLVKKKKIWVS